MNAETIDLHRRCNDLYKEIEKANGKIAQLEGTIISMDAAFQHFAQHLGGEMVRLEMEIGKMKGDQK